MGFAAAHEWFWWGLVLCGAIDDAKRRGHARWSRVPGTGTGPRAQVESTGCSVGRGGRAGSGAGCWGRVDVFFLSLPFPVKQEKVAAVIREGEQGWWAVRSHSGAFCSRVRR